MNIKIEGTADLRRALSTLAKSEIPSALRNTINDTAKDVKRREEQEIKRVFHKPTPMIQKPFYYKAGTKKTLSAYVMTKDKKGQWGSATRRALEPHMPDFSAGRDEKGMEYQLRRRRLMKPGQWLMPSRGFKLNTFGNVPGSQASKMLNDLHVFSDVSGYDSDTKESKRKYLWGTVRPRGKKPTTGIWLADRFLKQRKNALQMVVIDTAPTYAKRFRFHAVGISWATKVMPKHADLAFKHALERSKRR